MRTRGILAGAVALLAVAGCGDVVSAVTSGGEPFTLPVGAQTWDDVSQPAWIYDGVLHVGSQTVEIGDDVDQFVLGATGAYWVRGETVMFTSVDGDTDTVHNVRWSNIAASADRSVFATVDQSRGPKDEFGTRVMQVAVFDTTSGEQLYRTPDVEPEGEDLADLYGELMPMLQGVSDTRVFFDDATINLDDGTSQPAKLDRYPKYASTLFPDGYHVELRGEGRQRTMLPAKTSKYSVGRLSPDRTIVFDTFASPSPAVVYDAKTGRQRPIGTPWKHFQLVGFSGDEFYGIAKQLQWKNGNLDLRAVQVVSCRTSTLACTEVSPVYRPSPETGDYPPLVLEGPTAGMF